MSVYFNSLTWVTYVWYKKLLYIYEFNWYHTGWFNSCKWVYNIGWKIIGASPINIEEEEAKSGIIKIIDNIAKILALDIDTRSIGVINTDKYVGERYGLMSKEGKEVTGIVAKMESIILDPIYTSKVMACLFDYVKQEKLNNKDTVLFLHAGGHPIIFAYSDEFSFDNLSVNFSS